MSTQTNPVNRLYTEKEVAEILSVSLASLRRWRLAGIGPNFRKLRGTAAVRYRQEDLDAYIDASLRTSTTDKGGDGK
jgi:hypothetical protein